MVELSLPSSLAALLMTTSAVTRGDAEMAKLLLPLCPAALSMADIPGETPIHHHAAIFASFASRSDVMSR